MEEGQRPCSCRNCRNSGGLNPCCNGRGSKTNFRIQFRELTHLRLNPCCNGRGSKTRGGKVLKTGFTGVLILVVMEEGQRPKVFGL